jgi:hypothetical protein
MIAHPVAVLLDSATPSGVVLGSTYLQSLRQAHKLGCDFSVALGSSLRPAILDRDGCCPLAVQIKTGQYPSQYPIPRQTTAAGSGRHRNERISSITRRMTGPRTINMGHGLRPNYPEKLITLMIFCVPARRAVRWQRTGHSAVDSCVWFEHPWQT